jgi:carboxyl-terminal processing protease
MRTNIHKVFVTALFVLSLFSCDKMFLGEEEPDNPVNNFDCLWHDYNDMYGLFLVKNVNWDSLYDVYRPMIDDNSTDRELYDAITGLLGPLNDNHVTLSPTGSELSRYNSGILGKLKTFTDFKLSVVKNNYLTGFTEYSNTLQYGRINDRIGYIHFSEITEGIRFYEKAFDKILDDFKNTDGIIIDIRNNGGGIDKEAVYIAGRFTDETKTAFKFRLKNGPEKDNFTQFYEYTLKPEGGTQYLKKVVVLTHRFSVSAAETFTLTMKRNRNVTIIGDTTSGAFSDIIKRELPNGWIYTISIGDWRDAEGVSYEGTGIPPDLVIRNKADDIAKGKDEVLEKAIGVINMTSP